MPNHDGSTPVSSQETRWALLRVGGPILRAGSGGRWGLCKDVGRVRERIEQAEGIPIEQRLRLESEFNSSHHRSGHLVREPSRWETTLLFCSSVRGLADER